MYIDAMMGKESILLTFAESEKLSVGLTLVSLAIIVIWRTICCIDYIKLALVLYGISSDIFLEMSELSDLQIN